MSENLKLSTLFERVTSLLEKKDSRRILLLLLLMLISAVFEVVGLGLILPFIGLLSTPDLIESNMQIQKVYDWLGMATEIDFIVVLGCAIILLFLMKNMIYVLLVWLQSSFYLGKQHDLQSLLFNTYMRAPYRFHMKNNSAYLIRNITSEVASVCHGVFYPLLTIIAEVIVLIFVIGFLAYINPTIVAVAVLFILIIFIPLVLWMRPRSSKYGHERVYASGQVIKGVSQGLSAIKEIKVSQVDFFFAKKIWFDIERFIKASIKFNILNGLPRAAIESFSLTLIVSGMLIGLLMGVSAGVIVSTVTVFAVAFIRLMPSISKLIQAINTLTFNLRSLEVVSQEVALGTLTEQRMGVNNNHFESKQELFTNKVELIDVSYSYEASIKPSVDKVSLSILAGQSVAFVGKSGAGKSTLVEILLGLLEYDSGDLKVDGVVLDSNNSEWLNIIGYVPQSIFILDDTIRRNVAFGIEDHDIDDEKIWASLERASIASKVKTLPDGLEAMLGERGARLSGGEIQRIGIARALYSEPKILILDEATSALDNETERALSKTINSLMGCITLIVIAHRLSTVRKCDKVYFMGDGKVIDSGSFTELLESNDQFKRFATLGKEV